MKRKILVFLSVLSGLMLQAQDTSPSKTDKEEERRQRASAVVAQQEEGVLVYDKQNSFGFQLRTDGYGFFYELGRKRTPLLTNLYMIEITEIKHDKEKKGRNDGLFTGSYIYAKVNNFYQAKLGYGKQYILGQKGNKNGVAVLAVGYGGFSMGFLRPYYLDIRDGAEDKTVKYESPDSLLFQDQTKILGSSGLSEGWNELQLKPGAFVKTGLRFDFGRYNEMVQAVQIGISVEYYPTKIKQMIWSEPQALFVQGHLAFVFGRRK